MEPITQPMKSDRTRQRILDAAAACFSDSGYSGVTLRDIADRANIKAGSLYYHFDSKENLVEEVLHAGVFNPFQSTRRAVEALGQKADPVEKLRAAMAAHLQSILSESRYASANLRIFGQMPKEIRERHLEQQREYGRFWATLFRKAVASGQLRKDLDLSAVRMLVLGALNWSVEWFNRKGRTPAEIADHIYAIVFEGLLVGRQQSRLATTSRVARHRPG
jgi:TetR/AcrR family transcriptional regulator, cholesterol catabolism regulator